jgi:hypothetical protein
MYHLMGLFEENSVIQMYTAAVLQLFASKDIQENLSNRTYKTVFLDTKELLHLVIYPKFTSTNKNKILLI